MEEAKQAQPLNILLVEDENAHVDLIRRAFANWRTPVDLHVAQSMQAAEAFLQGAQPDAAIVDWVLPDGNGSAFLLMAKTLDRFPVIIMTSFGNEDLAVELLKKGATDYIVKSPHTLRDIPQSVDRALREFEHIQQRREAEAALRNANLKLEQMVAERTEALLSSNRSLEQFAYLVSHDLQEPLRMVTSYLQLLSKRSGHKLNQEELAYIHYASDGAKRMRNLLNGILMYSRLETIQSPKQRVDLNLTLQLVQQNLSTLITQKEAQLHIAALPVIEGVGTMLIQLFQNLIGNALKYCERQPLISLDVIDQGNQFQFSIQDNGIGIAQEYQKQIFEIFQRLHPQDKYPGTGVGLAICQKIVARHGGNIWVSSQVNEGTTFYFTLLKNQSPYEA